MNNAKVIVTAGVTSAVPNIKPVIEFQRRNAASFVGSTGPQCSTVGTTWWFKANGGTIDTNNHMINLTAPILHDADAG